MSAAVRRQPPRAVQFQRARSRPARRLVAARSYAQRCAAEHGIDLTGGRVLLLGYPRLFGYTFNPLSVYFCYDATGALALVIYEVRNTFGDIHPYVLPVQPGELGRRRPAAAAGQAVLRLALHRDGDALSFPRLAARRRRQGAHPGDRCRTARCSPPPSAAVARPLNSLALLQGLRAAAVPDPEGDRCDPLGGAAALDQRCAIGAASHRRGGKTRLGERNGW